MDYFSIQSSLLTPKAALFGVWRILEYIDYPDTRKVYPFGEHPVGYFIYTASGHVSVQIMASKSTEEPYSKNHCNLLYEYVGYFGSYSVDEKKCLITHHVEGGSIPSYIGTKQKRPYRLIDNMLFIGTTGEWERRLVRIGK